MLALSGTRWLIDKLSQINSRKQQHYRRRQTKQHGQLSQTDRASASVVDRVKLPPPTSSFIVVKLQLLFLTLRARMWRWTLGSCSLTWRRRGPVLDVRTLGSCPWHGDAEVLFLDVETLGSCPLTWGRWGHVLDVGRWGPVLDMGTPGSCPLTWGHRGPVLDVETHHPHISTAHMEQWWNLLYCDSHHIALAIKITPSFLISLGNKKVGNYDNFGSNFWPQAMWYKQRYNKFLLLSLKLQFV